MAFTLNRSLLNSKFEGYRLDPISQDDVIERFPLQYKPSQVTSSGRSPLSFEEVHSRITHNHLAIASDEPRAIYVDEDFKVILIDIDVISLQPKFRVLSELPRPIQTQTLDLPHREYPSAAFLSATTVLVSDGFGTLYILSAGEKLPCEPVARFKLRGDLPDLPFKLHNVFRTSPTTAVAVLSSRHYHHASGANDTHPHTSLSSAPNSKDKVSFDIWGVKIELLSLRSSADIRVMDLLWHRQGGDVPIYTTYDPQSRCYLLIGGSVYHELAPTTPAAPYQPSPDEIAPIPRPGEDLDNNNNNIDKRTSPGGSTEPPPPPYSWTQTSDSVTVAIPLPSNTPKSKIHVAFTPKTLTFYVVQNGDNPENIDAVTTDLSLTENKNNNDTGGASFSRFPHPHPPTPRYSAKAFWDDISVSSSFWTWDKEAESAFGILTLHLDKQHEGTKWSHVFASVGTVPAGEVGGDPQDVEVPETLDPSELWAIRESLEKYTASVGASASELLGQQGKSSGGSLGGLGHGVPSLAEGEMDEDIDGSVGRDARQTWINSDGRKPDWWKSDFQVPFQLLSTPLPGLHTNQQKTSLVVKNNVDGLVYSLNSPSSAGTAKTPAPIQWTHTATFCALSFVLASKQDVRFTAHTTNTVYAFDNGSRDRGGNVYIYRRGHPSEIWSKQSILKIGDAESGSLLGVGAVRIPSSSSMDHKHVIVCLLEGELVLIKGV